MKHGLWLALTIACMASCSKEEGVSTDPEEEAAGVVAFEIGIAPLSKVVTDEALKSYWEEGDQIGLFASKSVSGSLQPLQAAGNYLENLRLTFTGGRWIPDSTVYYTNDGESLVFYGYYPYDSTMTNPTSYHFEVASDQDAAADDARDFLLAATGPVWKNDLVLLNFAHQLALIQVDLSREVNTAPFDDDLTVSLTRIKRGVEIDLNHGIGEAEGTAGDVVMRQVGDSYVYRALVPAQPIDSRFLIRQTTPGREIDREYNTQDTLWSAGNSYRYKLTLGYGVDPDHVYAVGDVYPHVGPVVGIVYEVSNGGRNGKVLSLDEGNGLAWANHNGDPGADNMSSGINNMRDIAGYVNKTSYGWEDFPLFRWAHSRNNSKENYGDPDAKGVWYIPARDEGELLYEAYTNYGPTNFNNRLTGAGGAALGNGDYILSTCYGFNYAYRLRLSNGSLINNSPKTATSYSSRCILSF